jgi:hypothetical protein
LWSGGSSQGPTVLTTDTGALQQQQQRQKRRVKAQNDSLAAAEIESEENSAAQSPEGEGDEAPDPKNEALLRYLAQEARNRPNIDWQDKIHRAILRGLRNFSETP